MQETKYSVKFIKHIHEEAKLKDDGKSQKITNQNKNVCLQDDKNYPIASYKFHWKLRSTNNSKSQFKKKKNSSKS